MIQSVDESVGKIHQTIKNLGLEENTIIIFTSDNGGYGPATCMKPLRGGKGMYYEGGIREPMFVYWPEVVKSGSVCDVPVITTDFYPTFVELAGINLPENYQLDGKSLVSLIKGEKEVLNRESLYWHFPCYLQAYGALKDESRDPEYRTRPVSVIRKGDWKLLMFHEEWVLDGGIENIETNNSVELYNLKNDIGETNNLVNSEKAIAQELLKDLMEWQQQINAPIPEIANSEYK
jgi:arylsulfatase A-like enzyme